MEIDVKYNNGAFNFYQKDNLCYSGRHERTNWWSWIPGKVLYNGDRIVCRMNIIFRLPFKVGFKMNFLQEHLKSVRFMWKGFKRPYAECTVDQKTYTFIMHRGLSSSIFRDGKQIGAYFEKGIEFLGKNHSKLFLDDDVELDIVLSIVFAHRGQFNNDYSDVSFNLGNIAPEPFPRDRKWKPNQADRPSNKQLATNNQTTNNEQLATLNHHSFPDRYTVPLKWATSTCSWLLTATS